MFNIQRAAIGMVLGLLIGCILWYVSAMFAGAGHGSYLPTKLFCPFSLIVRQSGAAGADGTALDPMAVMVYGVAICGAWPTVHRRKTLLTVCVFHLLAVGICFLVAGDSY